MAHHHHHYHHGNTGDYASKNKEYWSENAEKAFDHDWVRALAAQIESHLKENLSWMGIDPKNVGERKMLDFACGDGFLSHALRPHFTKVIGLDLAEGMVDKYKRRAREAGIPESQMHAVLGDLTGAEISPSLIENKELFDFDLAISSLALHHIEDPQRTINRLMERLRPGGTVVIIDFDVAKKGETWVLDDAPAAHTIAHHGFDKAHMEKLLNEAGCKDVDYVWHKEESELPPRMGGKKQLFFARGRKA
ncbi:hypothetical protein D8B26_005706 [Coccidioides posadasii str. Silveira]|uniref:Uncharacterized protein n=2 Tax=Coccidioides posadasii TaxID=199306 RepID=E9DAM5_COCPS|nr:hypothetical protein CPC735_025020 [Coccidioides posadasii C735 delta SOWgp]EER27166.1 hypothetical protein CPC735_025020 [Coccidioides posadasii C735 delta SOWgp]EFW16361.1 conserved hypothetical protein [Coccidioides posadasii str. Silveira]QVM11055.1 hypothetical protein D8B26_005706 [Coccidioides posadasii str. Silveira]|eukprot:XP_003069311.1 hypothetical protein CPC735_025020 [Coccidioides posadasii C735 delta SOWgp]